MHTRRAFTPKRPQSCVQTDRILDEQFDHGLIGGTSWGLGGGERSEFDMMWNLNTRKKDYGERWEAISKKYKRAFWGIGRAGQGHIALNDMGTWETANRWECLEVRRRVQEMSKGEGPVRRAKQLNSTVQVLRSHRRRTRCSAIRGNQAIGMTVQHAVMLASAWVLKSPSACEWTTSPISRHWGDSTVEFQFFQEMLKKTFATVTALFCSWAPKLPWCLLSCTTWNYPCCQLPELRPNYTYLYICL